MKPPTIHSGAAELRAEQRRERARVAGEHERPQRARHHVELVQRDERRERASPKSHQPPSQTSQSTSGTPTIVTRTRETKAHRLIGRRTAGAGSRSPSSALRSSSSPKSGQSVSTKTSSA